MANLLVLVETQRNGAPRPVCLEALGRARDIGTQLGASVYAAVLLGRPPSEDLLTALSTGGADRILLAEWPEFDGCFDDADFQSHGPALRALVDRVSPGLVLFGAGPGAWELAPRLAAALGAVFLADIELVIEAGSRLRLGDGAGAGLDADVDVSAVGIVAPARYRAAHDGDEAEVEVVRLPMAEGTDAPPAAPGDRAADFRQSVALVGLADTGWQDALGDRSAPSAACARVAFSGGDTCAGAPVRVAVGHDVAGAQLQFDGAAPLLTNALGRALARR